MIKKILLLNILVLAIGLILAATDNQSNCADAQCQSIINPVTTEKPLWCGGWCHAAYNGNSPDPWPLPALPSGTTNRICWVSAVLFENFNGLTNGGECKIDENQTVLIANSWGNDSDAYCAAQCLNW